MLRSKMIDRLEGIVRESVRPMERIEAIKILHVDGLGGNGGDGHRSPTDEVIESALRYRAQAPLIDEMMKEIGVENPNVARMGDVFRTAKRRPKRRQGGRSAAKKEDDSRNGAGLYASSVIARAGGAGVGGGSRFQRPVRLASVDRGKPDRRRRARRPGRLRARLSA